jgi:hypothetical protein
MHQPVGGRGRERARIRTDASVLSPGNFIIDATVRPSHGRPNSHRPSVHPSAIVRVTTLTVAERCSQLYASRWHYPCKLRQHSRAQPQSSTS